MGEKYLIDTSTLIKYIKNTLPQSSLNFLDDEFNRAINLSIVTKVEVLAWSPANSQDIEVYRQFMDNATVYPINDQVGDMAILIRKATKVKLPDVFIAATAIVHNTTLIADNDKDFIKIRELNIGLKYLNPFSIEQ